MRHLRLLIPALLLLAFQSAHAQMPELKVADGEASKVFLEKMDVSVQVIGPVATSTWTMTFRNNTSRQLEGELTFPMPEGITVSRYAIDINGKLREAVPVDKARGTTVLEAIENRRVDPGLLERVEGNSFRTRIYPLPAGGVRTVVISYEEELKRATGAAGALRYNLSLMPRKAIPELTVAVSVLQNKSRPEFASTKNDIAFDSEGDNWTARKTFKDYSSNKPLSFVIPSPESQASQLLMQASGNHYYFLANTALLNKSRTRQLPDSLTIVWDASLSGHFRNRPQELALLDLYFSHLKNATVDLVVLRNTLQPGRTFTVSNGNWQALRKELEATEWDGGTQLGLINTASLRGKEVLLFSDGISTFGRSDIALGRKPVYCIASSPAADYPALRYIAQASGGSLIHLTPAEDLSGAGRELFAQPIRFLGVKPSKELEDTYPAVPVPAANGIAVAGVCYASTGSITLQYGYGNTVTEERIIPYDYRTQQVADAHLDRIWAGKKIADLDLQYDANRATIESLGRHYGLITRNTSLIVLESVSDYLRYSIEPPAELRDEYDRAMKLRNDQRTTRVQDRLQIAENAFNELQEWWGNPHQLKAAKIALPIPPPPTGHAAPTSSQAVTVTRYKRPVIDPRGPLHAKTGEEIDRLPQQSTEAVVALGPNVHAGGRGGSSDVRIGGGRTSGNNVVIDGVQQASPIGTGQTSTPPAIPPSNAAAPANTRDTYDVQDAQPFRGNVYQSYQRSPNEQLEEKDEPGEISTPRRMTLPPANDRTRNNGATNNSYQWHAASDSVEVANDENDAPRAMELRTRAFQFDTSFINQLARLPRDAQYGRYLKIREANISNPSFYFQMAAYFTAQNQKSLGLRILSNLAELEMENYEVTKMLGFKLKEEGEWEAAVSAFRKVLKWRPMDPQSYRDYGLALADAGHYQQALDTLNAALTGNIDESLEAADKGIEETIITEINNLITQHGAGLNKSAVSRKVLGVQPVDIRVVINWNMKNTDIDLWVTDPNNEKCFYSHKETEIGGRISSDITQGFGPEQFMLRKATPGKYKVEVNYYGDRQVKIAGPTTVMAEIYTAYGTPHQKRQVIVLQMVGRQEGGVYLGTFDFKR